MVALQQALSVRAHEYTMHQELLQCVMLAHQLRPGAGGLDSITASVLNLVFPNSIGGVLLKNLKAKVARKTPSQSLLARYRITLDIALLLVAGEGSARYGWIDSSPSKGHGWVWTQAIVLCDVARMQVFQALAHIINGLARLSECDEVLDEELMALMGVLRQHLRWHIYTCSQPYKFTIQGESAGSPGLFGV